MATSTTTMSATLTTTVLDAARNAPAAGVRFQLYWVEPRGEVLLRAGATNAAGTTDAPLLDSAKLSAGSYKLVLHVGDYFASQSQHASPGHLFLDLLPVVFVIEDASSPTHVQISVSPTGYAVHRI
jgi:5-hydroxyisourate hydrolase